MEPDKLTHRRMQLDRVRVRVEHDVGIGDGAGRHARAAQRGAAATAHVAAHGLEARRAVAPVAQRALRRQVF